MTTAKKTTTTTVIAIPENIRSLEKNMCSSKKKKKKKNPETGVAVRERRSRAAT